jgi:pectate lyase
MIHSKQSLRLTIALMLLFCSSLLAEPNIAPKRIPDSNRPNRQRRFWRNPWEDFAAKPDDWYKSAEGMQIANNILSWQSPLGSWPKNQSTTQEPFNGDRGTIQGTFDNSATTNEIRFLARAFRVTKDPRFQQAVLKAIDHIFKAQYPTGGWPQYYPPGTGYPRYITFNDNAMVRLMELMRDVATSPKFAFIDAARRKSAQQCFDRGIQCILKCQIKVNGKLTVWCAQHDEKDYSPRPARSYELISLSGCESDDILVLLMSLDNPSPEIRRAIKAGAEWFDSSKITGIRIIFGNHDRVVQPDPTAPPTWARFYEIETNRPFFSGRDGVKKYNLAEIEQERRGGYAWYGEWGERVAKDYAKWKQKYSQ